MFSDINTNKKRSQKTDILTKVLKAKLNAKKQIY